MIKPIWFIYLIFGICIGSSAATQPTGTLSGKVIHSHMSEIMAGVEVEVVNTGLKTVTDEQGRFSLPHVPVGNHSIRFSVYGFESLIKTNVFIYAGRITRLDVRLKTVDPVLLESINISGVYFPKNEKEPHSLQYISADEIFSAPGAAGDVSRMLKSFPGVSNLNDATTDLIIRGGSPTENVFFIDNLEIPNINHFPTEASTGGEYSSLNSDLIETVNFHTGGFSAEYGDRASSVINIKFREGNREEFDAQINTGFTQVGAIFEGPIGNSKGSWLFSGRYSFSKFVQDIGLVDPSVAIPTLGDIQAKVVYDISAKHSLTFLDVLGTGSYNFEDNSYSLNLNYLQNTMGINWRSHWNDNFFSNTSLSFSNAEREDLYTDQYNQQPWSQQHFVNEYSFNFRNFNYLFINSRNRIEFGLQIKQESARETTHVDPFVDYYGASIPALDRQKDYLHVYKPGLFFGYTWNPLDQLTATMGLRGDYSSFTDDFYLSPRFSFSYKLKYNFIINGGFGIYRQTLPAVLLLMNDEFNDLTDPLSTHYTLGFEYLFGKGLKLTLEFYDKEYKYLPINPDYPTRLISDRRVNDIFYSYDKLENVGTAYTRGIELLIQKKMTEKFYGILSATYFRSRYKDYFGIERNRIYDNRFLTNLTLGYRLSKRWMVSGKWTLIGGAPYTPIDIEKSKILNESILDHSQFLKARYPYYNSLNLRLEYRRYKKKSSFTTYLDIWNVFDHNNIAYYYWDKGGNQLKTVNQLGLAFITGMEIRF